MYPLQEYKNQKKTNAIFSKKNLLISGVVLNVYGLNTWEHTFQYANECNVVFIIDIRNK